jgi:hypothetical protein
MQYYPSTRLPPRDRTAWTGQKRSPFPFPAPDEVVAGVEGKLVTTLVTGVLFHIFVKIGPRGGEGGIRSRW